MARKSNTGNKILAAVVVAGALFGLGVYSGALNFDVSVDETVVEDLADSALETGSNTLEKLGDKAQDLRDR